MKKTMGIRTVLAAGLLIGGAWAQKPGMGKGMMGGKMGMHMMADSCPMESMLMHGMMGRSMIASGDGGVIILIANRLYKYDKNLVLKKETEIKIDTAAIRASMTGMMGSCRMMQGGTAVPPVKPGGPTGGNAPRKPSAPDATAKKDDSDGHESHH